jgi:hypothetical protein
VSPSLTTQVPVVAAYTLTTRRPPLSRMSLFLAPKSRSWQTGDAAGRLSPHQPSQARHEGVRYVDEHSRRHSSIGP